MLVEKRDLSSNGRDICSNECSDREYGVLIMAGSLHSAILFLISGILLIAQAVISVAVFDDGIGAMASGVFAFAMFVGMAFAYYGGFAAVTNQTSVDGPGYTTVTSWDTGQRVQATPCCGFCGGIAIIAVALIFAGMLEEDALFALAPSFIAGIFAFLAAIVFMIEYKGTYAYRAF
jgi:hypothetical protein